MKNLKYTLLAATAALTIVTSNVSAQKNPPVTIELTLAQAIDLARKQSIESFKNKNMYLAKYWEFRSYKAQNLPVLGLNSTPYNYSQSSKLQYNSQDSTESFVRAESLNSNVDLSLKQNITATGAVIKASSELLRINDIKKNTISHQSTPISISIDQPLNGYNSFRWKARIEPIKFERAKREFVQSIEDIGIKTTENFFKVVSAEINLKIAQTNYFNADTLFRIGRGRFEIGTVTQDELLDFELSFLNGKIELTKAKLSLQQARFTLNSFLGLDDNIVVGCIVPDKITKQELDIDKTLAIALENNPQILSFNQQLLEADHAVARTRGQSGFGATVAGSFGLEKNAADLDDVYVSPFNDKQKLMLSLNIPIIDWGARRGQVQMVKSDREVTEATVRQARIDFEQNIFQQVMEFNLQNEQVEIAAKADTIAQLGYDVTKQRFMIDKVDVLKLNSARNSLDAAKRNYVDALRRYWSYHFSIRKLTLYDFERDETLLQSLDQLLEKQ